MKKYSKPKISHSRMGKGVLMNDRSYDSYEQLNENNNEVIVECGSYVALPGDPFEILRLAKRNKSNR